MDRRARLLILALASLAAVWAAYRRLPVSPPEREGEWQPVER